MIYCPGLEFYAKGLPLIDHVGSGLAGSCHLRDDRHDSIVARSGGVVSPAGSAATTSTSAEHIIHRGIGTNIMIFPRNAVRQKYLYHVSTHS